MPDFMLQGPGKHLRVPARTRLFDDLLLKKLSNLAADTDVNVVSLGCGMDTRPWRLNMTGYAVSWVDIDQPCIAQLKQKLLSQAHAQTANSETTQHSITKQADGDGYSHNFPLHVLSYNIQGVDLSTSSLTETLLHSKWNPRSPTIWLLEAVIYYLPISAASQLLNVG